MSLEKDFSSSPITKNRCNWWRIIFVLIFQCNHCYNDPLTEKKSQYLNYTKPVDKNVETELEKNNRNSGNDLCYSKYVIQGEKTLPYIRGIRVEITRHTTCHNQRWQHLNFLLYFVCFAYNWIELESLFVSYSVIG